MGTPPFPVVPVWVRALTVAVEPSTLKWPEIRLDFRVTEHAEAALASKVS